MASIIRASVSEICRSQRYLLDEKVFTAQYTLIYNQRLSIFKEILRAKSIQKWGEDVSMLTKIIESESADGDCVVIGTIFKDMPNRTSVLDEYTETNGLYGSTSTTSTKNLSSPDDKLYLEDDSGRITLSGAIAPHISTLVTGVVVAVRGHQSELGVFNVSDWIFAGDINEAGKDSLSAIEESATESPIYVLLVSGLRVGGDSDDSDISLQLLVDFVNGELGGDREAFLASRIAKVIIAGDSVIDAQRHTTGRERGAKTQQRADDSVKQLDLLLAQLLGSCPVDLMPGQSDPSGISLPQQPLHACLFPHGSRFSSLHLVPNPHQISLDSVVVLGTSGQPIHDILRQTTVGESAVCETTCDIEGADAALAALVRSFSWGHLCPTAPDTLPCHPYADTDPFVILPSDLPSIYFAGNQEKFSSCIHATAPGHRTRFICVPDFRSSRQAVLVDIKSLSCEVLTFAAY